MSLWNAAQALALAFCVAVVVVETRVLLRREKYWGEPSGVRKMLASSVEWRPPADGGGFRQFANASR